jgi:uncharacterized coiled-coil DUF342 family protein
MKISLDLKNAANKLSQNYSEVNSKYNDLNNQLHHLMTERDNLLERLNSLREEEKELINKIEAEIGTTLTADLANKIMNE